MIPAFFNARDRTRTDTAENGHWILSPARLPIPPPGQKIMSHEQSAHRTLSFSRTRARNGTRTRDPNLGKVVLYQLSYSRLFQILQCKYTTFFNNKMYHKKFFILTQN